MTEEPEVNSTGSAARTPGSENDTSAPNAGISSSSERWLVGYLKQHPILSAMYAIVLIGAIAAAVISNEDKLLAAVNALVMSLFVGLLAVMIQRYIVQKPGSVLPTLVAWGVVALAFFYVGGIALRSLGVELSSFFSISPEGSNPEEIQKTPQTDSFRTDLSLTQFAGFCRNIPCEEFSRQVRAAIDDNKIKPVVVTSNTNSSTLRRMLDEATKSDPELARYRPALTIDGAKLTIEADGNEALVLELSKLTLRNGAEIVTNGANLAIHAVVLENFGGRIRAFEAPENAPPPALPQAEGLPGKSAGSVELAVIGKVDGSVLFVDLVGQYGGAGGKGTTGATPTDRGRRGSNAVDALLGCARGGSDGRQGLPGGAGGAGLPGGRGGDGGLLILRGRAAENKELFEGRFDGGIGGKGGEGGDGGAGGRGGEGGSGSTFCTGGRTGPRGDSGAKGPPGVDGSSGASGGVRTQ